MDILNKGDPITTLPVDKHPMNPEDIQIIDSVFEKNQSIVENFVKESKDTVLVGSLFVLLTLPQIEDIISKFIPGIKNSIYISILVRAFLCMALYFIIKHMYLVRKNK